ncbi:hypothetical protein [Clostridium disporicum]|uniref:hypothetical protein n=1 Tax=Clostridium disporicum TaxID=84024 RepID=UPI0034A5462E
MAIVEVPKELVTKEELSTLHPDFGLYKGVNFESIKYYRSDKIGLVEVAICTDGSLDRNIEGLENYQKKRELLNYFEI